MHTSFANNRRKFDSKIDVFLKNAVFIEVHCILYHILQA